MNNRLKKYFQEEQPVPEEVKHINLCQHPKACIKCGSHETLKAYAHGNQKQEMIGMFILCNKCSVNFVGKNIVVNIEARP